MTAAKIVERWRRRRLEEMEARLEDLETDLYWNKREGGAYHRLQIQRDIASLTRKRNRLMATAGPGQ